MYSIEGPESWFEDVGSARLSSGRADVRLDSDFAEFVRTEAYQVFLTPEGDCKGLYVSAKSNSGFEVRELQGGTATLNFNFRIIAKRKDIAAPRLEKLPDYAGPSVSSLRQLQPPAAPSIPGITIPPPW